MEKLSPKVDVVFRKLFGSETSKDILIALINSIVGPDLIIKDIEIRNPYNLAKYARSKESILDIKAVDHAGVWYNIEMQVVGTALYGKRAIYYGAKVYVDQIEEGVPYSSLSTTIGIHLLDFTFFKDERYFRHCVIQDKLTHESYEQLKYLQFYFVEMGKFRKQFHELASPLDRWIAFLNNSNILDSRELPETLRDDAAIVKAVHDLGIMGLEPEEQDIYDKEVLANMVDTGLLQFEREEGREEGRQEGREEGRQEGLQAGLQTGKEQLLSILIGHRFSTMPAQITKSLDALSSDQMNELAKALFSFTSLSELEDWLAARQ
jgi:predicted transposase/invertase (TIGR01784 family)